MEFNSEIFSQFDKKWALLTAGTMEKFNSMTISWGGLGTLWGVPVATVYVRTSRYTHDFMDSEPYFTVSFYPETSRKALGVFGSKSGRDIDKMHFDGLTAKEAGESVTFAEAEVTLVCKKLMRQPFDPENIPAKILDRFYSGDTLHDMYVGEVVDILRG